MDLQSVKLRFGIIGNSGMLNTALQTAVKVAPTDMNVLIQGESGAGKESFSKVIHQLSSRKHQSFIAVNCGAIPEGTIDSELFGHEKGAFTGASDKRKGYFESVNGGTLFLDEVGELPLGTQARLLRVLENGEFIKVGSSQVQKTDVRIVAATNKDLLQLAQMGKFREDLYYRLATVPIRVPKLSERKEDIYLLFRKFSSDFSETHHRNLLELSPAAQQVLMQYPWPGNIRQLKNITEQICVLENNDWLDADDLIKYLPKIDTQLPILLGNGADSKQYEGMSERDIFYKVLVDLRKDVNDLKKVVFGLLEANEGGHNPYSSSDVQHYNYNESSRMLNSAPRENAHSNQEESVEDDDFIEAEAYSHDEQENELSLEAKEIELIRLALTRNNGKRKKAAQDLGISERTLYRKIKQYELD